MTSKEIEERLESMIDSQGMVAVLAALVMVCDDKAIHVETNWQDKGLARAWRCGANKIQIAARYDWPL